jgi:hypothetical protein
MGCIYRITETGRLSRCLEQTGWDSNQWRPSNKRAEQETPVVPTSVITTNISATFRLRAFRSSNFGSETGCPNWAVFWYSTDCPRKHVRVLSESFPIYQSQSVLEMGRFVPLYHSGTSLSSLTLWSPRERERERERVRKDSIRVEVKRKHLGESERRFISEGKRASS